MLLKVVIALARVTARVLAVAHAYLTAVHLAVTHAKALVAILATTVAVAHVTDAKITIDKIGSKIHYTPVLSF